MRWFLATLLAGCAASGPVVFDPSEVGSDGKADGGYAVPDVRCDGAPDAGPATKFRHFSSRIISALGDPRHRGFDLIAAASDETQTIAGAISYTIADKALEDEDVDVFACRAGSWDKLGRTRTDDEGRFALVLRDGDRLPLGMRDLYVSVGPDRTGTRFLGLVASDDTPVIATDIDGTLTSSELEFFETIVLGIDADARPDAADAFQVAATKGYQLVYLTARGQQYTYETRDWLDRLGFPRGPLRLSPSFLTLPGGDTVEYKTEALQSIAETLPLAAGVGNRESDISAYAAAGIDGEHVWVETSEYPDELAGPIAAGQALGFASYDELRTGPIADLPPH